MIEANVYQAMLGCWFALSLITFVVLLGRTAPYGRHARTGWGPSVGPRLGWVMMELPAVVLPCALLLPSLLWPPLRDGGREPLWAQGWLLFGLWQLHYVHRALIWPFRLRSTKRMPLTVVMLGLSFQCMNSWLVSRGLTHHGPELGRVALTHPRVLIGSAVFVAGLVINLDADTRLLALPRTADGGYTIPDGGLYRYVSCPNYLGELLEWLGFALIAGSLGALAFFAWSAANLLPRARAHHRWYQEHFATYPSERRAVLPFVW